MDVQRKIIEMCDRIAQMLITKNRKYGNSALSPLRIFSKADLLETIRVRMDDKLCRIRNQQGDEDEDAYMDLAGYLVLYMIAREGQAGVEKEPPPKPFIGRDNKALPNSQDTGGFKLKYPDNPPMTKICTSGELLLDKMEDEALVMLMVQAMEKADYPLINAIKAEEKRRCHIKNGPDGGCGFDETSVTPTT